MIGTQRIIGIKYLPYVFIKEILMHSWLETWRSSLYVYLYIRQLSVNLDKRTFPKH